MEPEKIDTCKSRLIELKAQAESRVVRVSSSGVNSAEGFWGIDETAAM